MNTATLEYALVGGEIRFAHEFIGVAPADRPSALCPCCGEPVTWKAGEVLAPHVAHTPESTCTASGGETLLHRQAKDRIAEALRRTPSLWISTGCKRCSHHPSGFWSVDEWCDVRTELLVQTRRPDVALIGRSGRVVAAVEIYHSHKVDRAKAEDLRDAGLPWVEVHAKDALEWAEGAMREQPAIDDALAVVNADALTLETLARSCTVCRDARVSPVARDLLRGDK